MDFDWQWLLLAAPLLFAAGWIAARLDLRQLRRARRETPSALFKGLNLLLNEQHDAAIDAFIEAVQNDPDTAELHFALGNLFRRRGEYERAVRVHEHLLQRADLTEVDRARAQQALALDYQRAGLFDRAEAAWRALEGTPLQQEARVALLGLLERARDWPAALAIAKQLGGTGDDGQFAPRIAHHHAELAQAAQARGDEDAEAAELQAAAEAAPQALRPQVQMAQRHARRGEHAQAAQRYGTLAVTQASCLPLIAEPWALSVIESGDAALRAQAETALQTAHAADGSVDVLRAWLRLRPAEQAVAAWTAQLQARPGLRAAHELMNARADAEPGLQATARALARSAAAPSRHRCAACGFEAQRFFWQCPGCLSWDSFPPQRVEEL
jgi:lipopolysaccharide assembly protein B